MAGYDPQRALDDICQATGLQREQVADVVGRAFEILHKIAVCEEMGVIRAVMECHFQLDLKACYHLGGLLEQGRLLKLNDPDNPWYDSHFQFASSMERV